MIWPFFAKRTSPYRLEGPTMRRDTARQFEVPNLRFEIPVGGGFSLVEVVLVTAIIAVCAAIAIPRYGSAAGRYRADLAARRVAADLRQAQSRARMISAACTIAFTPSTSKYQIVNAPSFDGAGGTYTVDLTVPPYQARIVSANFNGSDQVAFSGWGLPNKAGTVVIAVGPEQRTISLNGQTGQVSIQ
jgi:prepilin-type N-terminal cleavage/methylation domain-containing protein